MILHTAHALIQGLSKAGVKRLLIVGGAGSLEVAPGLHLLDTPEFPAVVKPFAAAHRDALEVYRKEAPSDLEWTYLSPAGVIAPGERTGQFRLGTDQLLTDEQGRSHISVEDFAIALLNELEQPQAIRRRITVAY
jgi:putative NADH-flavin reductase